MIGTVKAAVVDPVRVNVITAGALIEAILEPETWTMLNIVYKTESCCGPGPLSQSRRKNELPPGSCNRISQPAIYLSTLYINVGNIGTYYWITPKETAITTTVSMFSKV